MTAKTKKATYTVDHLGRKSETSPAELLEALEDFEKYYRPNGRRAGPPSRYDISRMYNALRPVLLAAAQEVQKTPKTGKRIAPVVRAFVNYMDKWTPFFYGREYGQKLDGSRVFVPGALRGDGDDPPPPDPDPCGINGSAYWDMTGD